MTKERKKYNTNREVGVIIIQYYIMQQNDKRRAGRRQTAETMEFWKKYGSDGKAVIGIGIAYLVMEFVFGITCPIKFLTGISCAGCGMSRAYLALLSLDFRAAFGFHPLFPLPVLLLAAYFFRSVIPPRVFRGILWTTVALFILVYFYRLFYDKSDLIVVFQPKEGLLWHLYTWLKRSI